MKNPQEQINKWCEKYEVPIIPVNITEDLLGAQAYFDGTLYQIFVSKNVKKTVLQHEFTHYLIQLVGVSERIEEKICNRMEDVIL